jgi:hypothetical protein
MYAQRDFTPPGQQKKTRKNLPKWLGSRGELH